jgi:hypothetical protein
VVRPKTAAKTNHILTNRKWALFPFVLRPKA